MIVPCYGIIPARYASTRFPGKALVDIAGKPMIWHVYTRAKESAALLGVTLATDDERIRSRAEEFGLECVMTRPDHPSGTDRVYEAACALGLGDEAVIINIQGDEPMLDPAMLDEIVAPFADPKVEVTTLASEIQASRARETSQVKVVTDIAGNALYFSRAMIPCSRDESADTQTYLGHIGLYAFRMRALAKFVSQAPSRLEKIEKLEQLRFLENGIPIRVVLTSRHSPGVDIPEDLERVHKLFV